MSEQDNNKPQAAKSGNSFDFSTKIYELWNGKVPLFQAFWLYYVAVVFGLSVLSHTLAFLSNGLGLLTLIWSGFMIKPIILAANQYKGPSHWALGAKIAAVLLAISVAGDLMARLFG